MIKPAVPSFYAAFCIAMAAALGACSFDVPKHSGTVTLSVQKQDSPNPGSRSALAALDVTDLLFKSPVIRTESALTIANFGCYAVNITGAGVTSTASQLQNCTSTDNMNGAGVGAVSNTFPAGTSISVAVPSQVPLTIDVYGVYPPDQTNCPNAPNSGQGSSNGGGNGYFLGRVVQTLTSDASVTVGTSYNGAGPDVVCAGGGGGGGGGNSFYVGGTFPFGGDSSGGWTFQVSGGGFVNPATVSIGSTPCTSTTFVSSSALNCLVPSGLASQSYAITVTNPNGATASQSGSYFWINSGGEYISLAPNTNSNQVFVFGNVPVNTVKDITVTVQNTGLNDTAYPMVAPTLTPPFQFGGAAAFPGAGGTCNTTNPLKGLSNNPPNGGSCTVVLEFAPTSAGAAAMAGPIYFLNASDPAYSGAAFQGGLSGTGI